MTINKNLLCMKWDEFNNFVVTGLSNLYQRDEMADVTLFCDGRSFKAHKTILSIWSPYFKEIFAATAHPHPVIILQETVVSDLELILRFIYQGQLFVPYEEAERFLRTAEHFQVAGLKSMRINPPATQQTSLNGHVSHAAGTGLMSNVPSDLSTSSCSSRPQTLQSQFGPAAGTSFTPIVINNGSSSISPGVPYRINSNDLPSASFNNSIQQQQSHSTASTVSSSYPTEIVRPNQSAANVIKSHPRIIQHESTQMRPPSPVLISQPSSSVQSPAFQPLPLRNDKQQHSDRVVYQTNPQSVLIVHNPNTSHNGYQSLKDTTLVGKQSDTVVVVENVSSVPNHGGSTVHAMSSGNSGCGTYTVYNNHGSTQHQLLNNAADDDEVLGLGYLQDSNRTHHHQQGSHTQIIQDAAIAAGVDVEEHETSTSTSAQYPSPTQSATLQKSFNKEEEVVIISAPNAVTPVYAVKRQVTLNTETLRAPPPSKPSTSTRNPPKDNKVKIVKGKQKKDSITKVQPKTREQGSSLSTEFINCPKCTKSVKKSSLKVHMKRTHLEEGTILTCPICDKQIRSKGVYYKHMYLHRQKVPDNEDSGKLQNTRSR